MPLFLLAIKVICVCTYEDLEKNNNNFIFRTKEKVVKAL